MTFVHRIARLGPLAGLMLVALAAISPALGADSGVSIEGRKFEPARIVVALGDTVTWTVTSSIGEPHTVTSGKLGEPGQGTLFDSQKDDPGLTKLKDDGGAFAVTFDKAGTFDYLCTVHATQMTGVVVVLAPGESAPAEPEASEAPEAEGGGPIPAERKLLGGGILAVTLVVLFGAGLVYRRMNPGP